MTANTKMYPPLRTRADREAIQKGLADGTLDAIASDHAPHSSIEKMVEFDQAANGVIGLETSLPLALKLVHERVIGMERLVELMAVGPARILGERTWAAHRPDGRCHPPFSGTGVHHRRGPICIYEPQLSV